MSYWQERQERQILKGEETAKQIYKKTMIFYNQAMKDIENDIIDFYAKYGIKEIDMPLTAKDIREFRNDAKKWAEQARRDGWREKDINALVSLSKRSRISRKELILEKVKFSIKNLSQYEIMLYQNTLPFTYLDNLFETTYAIQSSLGVGYNFDLLNSLQMTAVLNYKFYGDNFSDAVWGAEKKNLKKLEYLIPNGFVNGYNPKKVAKMINQATGGVNENYPRCERLARTEMNLVGNQATINAYNQSGFIEDYEYLATLDNRTSEICSQLDGKIFPTKKSSVGVNYPPMHPNCRSTTTPVIDDDEITERIAKDKEGKYYNVPGGMKFNEWFETLDDEHKKQFKNLKKRSDDVL